MNKLARLKDLMQRRSHAFLRGAGVLGVLVGWAAMYFFEEWNGVFFWMLICAATVLSATGAWGGLAEQWGYKPLSSDPLGWRAAKKSYEKPGPSTDENDKSS